MVLWLLLLFNDNNVYDVVKSRQNISQNVILRELVEMYCLCEPVN